METLISNNIKLSHVENLKELQELIKPILCYICLEIPISAMECFECESIICEDCNEILKIAEKKCLLLKCKGNIKKANKFIRETLSRLIITCLYCDTKGIEYQFYSKHLEEICLVYKLVTLKTSKYLKDIKEKNAQIDIIKDQIDQLKLSTTMSILNKSPKKYSKESVRNMLMTFNLPVNQKMELYNATIQGDLNTFKQLVMNKNYPLFEEISASSYYWTAFHYAMHYGQIKIIQFIFDLLKTQNKIELALQLVSSDGRCPLLCLLRSNSVDLDKKKGLFDKLLKQYKFTISSVVKRELKSREMGFIIE